MRCSPALWLVVAGVVAGLTDVPADFAVDWETVSHARSSITKTTSRPPFDSLTVRQGSRVSTSTATDENASPAVLSAGVAARWIYETFSATRDFATPR